MGTKLATEVRLGNVLKVDQVPAKVVFYEIRGTGKFGKTVHLKLKNLFDGHLIEKSLRVEEKVEDIDVHYVTLQYLYKEGDQFVFMDNQSFEQYSLSAKAIGKQKIFLSENSEVKALYIQDKPVNIEFSKTVELKVVSAPAGVKGGTDSTYKEVELENGLKILVPQFVREGETVRLNTEDFSYQDRVTTKSMKAVSE